MSIKKDDHVEWIAIGFCELEMRGTVLTINKRKKTVRVQGPEGFCKAPGRIYTVPLEVLTGVKP